MKKSDMFRVRWNKATDLDDYVALIEDMLQYIERKEIDEECGA